MRAEHFLASALRKEQNTCIFDETRMFFKSSLADKPNFICFF